MPDYRWDPSGCARFPSVCIVASAQCLLGAARTQNAGAAAFKSSTKRGKESDLNYMGDPGAYDAYAGAELASTAGKSFGKSTQSGQGGFGSTAQARQPLAQASEAQRAWAPPLAATAAPPRLPPANKLPPPA